MTSPSPTRRRTQEERREETRRRLLDATIRSLVDSGYAATTGRRVAELAGVSRGAQTHHFPQMSDLVTEAIEHLADRRITEMRRRASALRAGEDPIAWFVDLLYEDFSSDLFRAVVKLWIAAADDPGLRERLTPLERHLRSIVRAFLADATAGLGDVEISGPRLELALNAVRGLAFAEAFEPRTSPPATDRWAAIRPLLIDALTTERPDP
ncbi:MAG: TetR family transcriptional regulator [Solirubrobacteraceae bacterium]|nr:TetR family transcriptional regulator [Solirubrobacteraceae bacterium]